MKRILHIKIILVFCLIISGSASADITQGVSATELARCNIKSCFINLMMLHKSEILKQQKNNNGTFFEVYKFMKSGNIGLAEYVNTIVTSGKDGLWKIVNYPIDGYVSNDSEVIFKSLYNKKEEASLIEIQLPQTD